MMTPEEMEAYIQAQLATITSQRQEARLRLTQAQHELTGLDYAQQAYQDMLEELRKRSIVPDEPETPVLDKATIQEIVRDEPADIEMEQANEANIRELLGE